MFKVVIIGGDGFNDYPVFEKCCIACLRNKAKEGCGIMIYTTGEKANEKFAMRFSIDIRYFITNWKKYGNDALLERNKEILSDADAIICFDDGTNDTKHFISQAKEKGIAMRYFSEEAKTKYKPT